MRKGSKINLRFISLLAVVILLQQFTFASLHHAIFFGGGRQGQLHIAQKQPVGQDAFLFNVDVEVAEEDEVQHDEDLANCTISSLYMVLKRFRDASARIHYLDHADDLAGRSDLPLFMLYHSWKSDLS